VPAKRWNDWQWQTSHRIRSRFSGVAEEEIALIGEKLRNPFKQ